MPRAYDYPRESTHLACRACGELADECACRFRPLFGTMRITPALSGSYRPTANPAVGTRPAPLGATVMSAPTADPFSAPPSSSGAKITEFEGSLLLITPTGYRENVTTINGPADAVEADVAVLDGPHMGEDHANLLIFQRVLIGQTRPKIGQGMVLGRLGKGKATPGKSAPWTLTDPTEDDNVLAREYLADKAKAADKAPF